MIMISMKLPVEGFHVVCLNVSASMLLEIDCHCENYILKTVVFPMQILLNFSSMLICTIGTWNPYRSIFCYAGPTADANTGTEPEY